MTILAVSGKRMLAFGTLVLMAWTVSLRGQSAFSAKLGKLGRETQRDWASVLLFKASSGLDDLELFRRPIRTGSILKNPSLENTGGEAAAPASTLPVKVVDLIPASLSGGANQDSEPFLAIQTANPQGMVASAFTPNPVSTQGNAPVYVSQDGGNTWVLNAITPVQR